MKIYTFIINWVRVLILAVGAAHLYLPIKAIINVKFFNVRYHNITRITRYNDWHDPWVVGGIAIIFFALVIYANISDKKKGVRSNKKRSNKKNSGNKNRNSQKQNQQKSGNQRPNNQSTNNQRQKETVAE